MINKQKTKQNKTKQTHKKYFLVNPNCKQCFINKPSNVLKDNLFETLYAADDADCLTVGTTLKLAKGTATALVGEDTDLLALLLFHVQPEHCEVLFSTGTKSAAKVCDVKVVQAAIAVETSVRTSSDHVWSYSGRL